MLRIYKNSGENKAYFSTMIIDQKWEVRCSEKIQELQKKYLNQELSIKEYKKELNSLKKLLQFYGLLEMANKIDPLESENNPGTTYFSMPKKLKNLFYLGLDALKASSGFIMAHPGQALTIGLAAQISCLSSQELYSPNKIQEKILTPFNPWFNSTSLPLDKMNFSNHRSLRLLKNNSTYSENLYRDGKPLFFNKKSAGKRTKRQLIQHLDGFPPLHPLPEPISPDKVDLPKLTLPNSAQIENNFQQVQDQFKSQNENIRILYQALTELTYRYNNLSIYYAELSKKVLRMQDTGLQIIKSMGIESNTTIGAGSNATSSFFQQPPQRQENSATIQGSNEALSQTTDPVMGKTENTSQAPSNYFGRWIP